MFSVFLLFLLFLFFGDIVVLFFFSFEFVSMLKDIYILCVYYYYDLIIPILFDYLLLSFLIVVSICF